MLTIRRYEPADHPAVLDLHVLGLKQAGAYWGSGPWDRDLNDINGVYLANNGEFLVGTEDGRLVTMGAFRKTSPAGAEIKRMRVHPDFQRRGYAQLIFNSLEKKAVENGYTFLHLETSLVQVPAQKFYLKNGFHETKHIFLHEIECILYEKMIGP